MKLRDLEGYDDVLRKLIEGIPPQDLLGLFTPVQRLSGLSTEEVLATFTVEELLMALPTHVLRFLPDTFLDTLSAQRRAAIRARIGR